MDWSPDQKFGVPAAEDIAALTGREFLQAIIDGRLPAPTIAKTMSFNSSRSATASACSRASRARMS